MTKYGPGIKVDVDRLALGLFRLMLDHRDGSCMTVGMLVAEIMDSFDRGLGEKLSAEAVGNSHIANGLVVPINADDTAARIRRAVSRDVAARVIGIATEKGICRV